MSKRNRSAERFAAWDYPILKLKNKMAFASNPKPASNDGFRKFIAAVLTIVKDLALRWLILAIFVFVPVTLMVNLDPRLVGSRELLVVFIWFLMIVLREGYVHTKVFNLKENDRVLIKEFGISAKDNFLGKFAYRVISEFIFHISALFIMHVSTWHAIALSLMTLAFRAIGERRSMKFYKNTSEKIKRESLNRFRVIFSIVTVCIAYGVPLIFGGMAGLVLIVVNPIVVAIVCAYAAMKYFFMTKSNKYGDIATEVICGG